MPAIQEPKIIEEAGNVRSPAVFSSFKFGVQFWKFLIASLFFDLGMFVFAFLYNLYLLDRGMTEKTMGWIAAAMSLGTMLATFPAGVLARKIGFRNALLCCLTLVPIISAARAVVQSDAALVLLALAGGAVFSIWAVCLPPTVARLTTDHNRSVGFSLIFALGIGSGIIGGYLGGHLPSWLAHIQQGSPATLKQSSLLLASAFVLMGVVPCSRLAILEEPFHQTINVRPTSPYLRRFLPPVTAWSFALGILSPFLAVYLTKNLHLELPQVGTMFSLSQFLQMLSVLLAPRLFRRHGTLFTVTLSQIVTAVSLVGFVSFSAKPWMLASFAAMSLFQYMNEPGLYTLLMSNVRPEEQSGASAWNFFLVCGAQTVAALTAAAVIPRLGYFPVLISSAVLMTTSALVLYLCLRGHGLKLSESQL
ncbi:MAG TPA: MFS transporter [Candidatus Sulfotelmatobacter sp.]|nr:MFS transporter [Candidatus Sulfotelmatobacter sp.]